MLKSAVIGCGAIAEVHKKVLTDLPEAELAACCDIRAERAEAFAAGSAIRPYSSAEELLKTERPDVVHLCVPHPLHTPLAVLAAGYGAAVFTEKPPAVDEVQWRELMELERRGARIGVCFQNRYNGAVRRARELIRSGEAGEVRGARAFLTWYRDASYYTDSGWRGSWRTEGGGVLINQAIHTLDLMTYLMGEPAGVKCHMSNRSLQGVIEVEDTFEAYIRFSSGARAVFYATNAYCANAPVFIELECERAALRLEGDALTITRGSGVERTEGASGAHPGKDYWGRGHYDCIKDFYRAIIEDRPYQNDVASARDTMRLLLDMYGPYRGKKISEDQGGDLCSMSP